MSWWLCGGLVATPVVLWGFYCVFRVVQVIRISASEDDDDMP